MELIDYTKILDELEVIIKDSKGDSKKKLTKTYKKFSDEFEKIIGFEINKNNSDYRKLEDSLEKISYKLISFKKEQKKILEIFSILDEAIELMEKLV